MKGLDYIKSKHLLRMQRERLEVARELERTLTRCLELQDKLEIRNAIIAKEEML